MCSRQIHSINCLMHYFLREIFKLFLNVKPKCQFTEKTSFHKCLKYMRIGSDYRSFVALVKYYFYEKFDKLSSSNNDFMQKSVKCVHVVPTIIYHIKFDHILKYYNFNFIEFLKKNIFLLT